jgi:hypothetical protein
MLYRNMVPPARERGLRRPRGLHWLRLSAVSLALFWPDLPTPPWW